MNVHKNARLTPRGRERIIERDASGQTPQAISQAVGVDSVGEVQQKPLRRMVMVCG